MKRWIRLHWRTVVSYLFLIVYALFIIAPLYWLLTGAFKPETEIVSYPPTIIPKSVTLEHVRGVLANPMIVRFFANSIVVALGTILVSLVISIMAGYAFSRLEFKSKRALMVFIMSVQMIPFVTLIIPLYFIFANMGLLDTYTSLVLVYSAGAVPLNIWLLKGYFDSIPGELEESAMIDGCTGLQAFFKILLPLSAPGISAAIIFSFITAWNEFMVALVMTSSTSMRTYPVGLYYFVGIRYGQVDWGPLSAALFIATVPLLIVFIFFEKQFITGLTGGALKG